MYRIPVSIPAAGITEEDQVLTEIRGTALSLPEADMMFVFNEVKALRARVEADSRMALVIAFVGAEMAAGVIEVK